jgi:hypothetical protein
LRERVAVDEFAVFRDVGEAGVVVRVIQWIAVQDKKFGSLPGSMVPRSSSLPWASAMLRVVASSAAIGSISCSRAACSQKMWDLPRWVGTSGIPAWNGPYIRLVAAVGS